MSARTRAVLVTKPPGFHQQLSKTAEIPREDFILPGISNKIMKKKLKAIIYKMVNKNLHMGESSCWILRIAKEDGYPTKSLSLFIPMCCTGPRHCISLILRCRNRVRFSSYTTTIRLIATQSTVVVPWRTCPVQKNAQPLVSAIFWDSTVSPSRAESGVSRICLCFPKFNRRKY